MKKTWMGSYDGRSIDAMVGAFGIPTSKINDESHLLDVAKELFELPKDIKGIEAVASVLRAMGKKNRSKIANKRKKTVLEKFAGNRTVQQDRCVEQPNKIRGKFDFRLTKTERQELQEWLPKLQALKERAVKFGYPWAKCYDAEIRMINNGLERGYL